MRLLALRCNYFAEVAGVWVSEEGTLYVVSKVYGEGIKQAKSLFNHEGDGSPKEDGLRVRLALELCEILMDIHAAGVVVGVIEADSFTLDVFGHLRLHIGKCAVWTGDSEYLSPEFTKEAGGDEYGLGSLKSDVWSLGCLLLQLFSGSSLLGGLMYSEVRTRAQIEALEQKAGFKEQLLNCMAAVPSNRPRVVDVWRELKELLEDQPLEIPSHFMEDKLDVEISKSESTTPDDDSWIDPETASEMDFKQVATMEGHKGVVSVLMVQGQFLFSGSWDGTIRMWWRPDHSSLAVFGGRSSVPSGVIRSLVKCPASGLLYSGHDSGYIQIWSEEDCVGSFKAHTAVISALALDQNWLYSRSWDGFVKAWPLQDILSESPIPVERKCSQAAVTALCCSVQHKLFVGTTQKIQVYGHELIANHLK